MAERPILSVTKLNEYVSGMLGRDPVLRNLRVQGEISDFKRHFSGHLYFSLKDEEALVRCVMFKQRASLLEFQPQNGGQVVVEGYATLYAKGGQFQLYVQDMQEMGEGELYRRFQLLKTRLEAKGYFSSEHKRPIPFLPSCVGVITSETGAVLHDILNVTKRRFPNMRLSCCFAKVQGAGAAEEIADAIRFMNDNSRADVLILARGGGSMEDLWPFNEMAVAQAIYESRIPVVSAVGHETDFTIADFVADLRAPTPSAAAERCVPVYDDLCVMASDRGNRLSYALGYGVEKRRSALTARQTHPAFTGVVHRLNGLRQGLDQASVDMLRAASSASKARRVQLEHLRTRLMSADPKALMERGYVFLTDEAGAPLGRAGQLEKDMDVRLHFADGDASARIGEVHRTTGGRHGTEDDI